MGQSRSRPERTSKCLDFPQRFPSQSNFSVRSRNDAVAALDFALGVRLSWLTSRLVASANGGSELTLQSVMEDLSADGPAMDSDAFGPATHVVLVHPSTPWSAFLKASLNHVGMDPRKIGSTEDVPLSPRSPLLPFAPLVNCKPQNNAAAGSKQTDPEAWADEGLSPSSADHLYHSTFLNIDCLVHAPGAPPASLPPYLAPAAAAQPPSAWAASGYPSSSPFSGDAAERVLGRMSGEPAALLMVDPAGAIFTDPRAIRAVAAALAVLRKSARAKELQLQLQGAAAGANANAPGGRPPRLQLASALGGADWAPVAAAFGRVPGLLPDDPAAARAVCEAVLESARLQYNAHWPLLNLFSNHASFSMEAECVYVGGSSSVGGGGGYGGKDGEGATGGRSQPPPAAGRHILPGQIETTDKLAIDIVDPSPEMDDGDGDGFQDMCGDGRDHGPDSQSGIAKFARELIGGRAAAVPPPMVPPADAEALSLVLRSRSMMGNSTTVSATRRRSANSGFPGALPYPAASGDGGDATAAAAACSPPAPSSLMSVPYSARGGGTLSATIARSQLPSASTSSHQAAMPDLHGAPAAMFMSAMASVASSCGGGLEGTGHLVSFAVEAARRYGALLEAVGLWAGASGVLEACLCAVGERWGHRSGRMAALLTQLGKLQQMQGLHKSAEVTLRQALEALDSIYGPVGVPVFQCRVALGQVMASLREPDAETMMRSGLAELDTFLGPMAAETLAAREVLAGFLAQEGRWMEAEVVAQGLLLTMEEAPPRAVAAAAGTGMARQRQGSGGGRPLSQQQQPVARALPRVASQQQLLAGGGAPGLGQSRREAHIGAGGPRESDLRSRLAWGTSPEVTALAVAAPVAEGAVEEAQYGPGSGGGCAQAMFHRTVLPPLASGSGNLPTIAPMNRSTMPLPPLPAIASSDSRPPANPKRVGAGGIGVGPGNADPLAWSGAAAGLADVIAAVQREYGGENELYNGMHLAGPEGTMAADLAALAAVCPRSGACIASVVNVRRLTDASALYAAALAMRMSALDATHLAMLDLKCQYARHLSASGEHSRAEATCQAALEQLIAAPPPGRGFRRPGSGGVGTPHPAEVGLRQELGDVLLAAGSLAGASAALTAAVELAERLVASGDLAAADARRVKALDSLAGVLWQQAQAGGGGSGDGGGGTATEGPACQSHAARAIECKRQALELTAVKCGERHERVMRGWVGLGEMMEAVGDLAAAERAFESAAEVALHRHSRLSAATKAIFRQLQRVYQAQGRTADAQILGHMYRLKGGLLSAPLTLAPLPAAATPVPAQA